MICWKIEIFFILIHCLKENNVPTCFCPTYYFKLNQNSCLLLPLTHLISGKRETIIMLKVNYNADNYWRMSTLLFYRSTQNIFTKNLDLLEGVDKCCRKPTILLYQENTTSHTNRLTYRHPSSMNWERVHLWDSWF